MLNITKNGQMSTGGVVALGISVILGGIMYVVGQQVLNQNNLQSTGLFPTGLFLISVVPVLAGVFTFFKMT